MIMQLHSSEYRRPAQLREGPVLVVGASHSGADVAYEVAADHPTILCGRDTGQIPVRLTSPLFKVVFPIILFVFEHVLTRRTPMGRKEMDEFRFHGGPALRVKRSDLRARGVERLQERVVGVEGGRPVLDGGRVVDVANVVWCTGFRRRTTGSTCRSSARPAGRWRCAAWSTRHPGLYFCGLGFQYAAASMLIAGDRPGHRVRREAHRRAHAARGRRRSVLPDAGRLGRSLRRGGCGGHRRRAHPGAGGVRSPRVDGGARPAVRARSGGARSGRPARVVDCGVPGRRHRDERPCAAAVVPGSHRRR